MKSSSILKGQLKSVSGVWRRLKSWKISFKKAQSHITSPDVEYEPKRQLIKEAYSKSVQNPDKVALLYSDEMTIYRQPTLERVYHQKGKVQPKAENSHKSNTKLRIISALDSVLGCVISFQAYKIGVKQICELLQVIKASYMSMEEIYIVWDNWPIHKHEKVLQMAQQLNIQILWLPTYAPWLNPIEKLWRKLKQEIVHVHRYSDRWDEFKKRIRNFLEGYSTPSPELLQYVGLSLPI